MAPTDARAEPGIIQPRQNVQREPIEEQGHGAAPAATTNPTYQMRQIGSRVS